ncbi:polyhydroxyalkanoate depolymerase [Larsenimonas suaedae]|uniref:Polyhydroxyalkanoate depolymerase n=1 Tax=Larsenimonas suaedae TaxID=1851019 RepID=A0ABU1GWR6_9GAMM|nr:polyhydroxyalkanoate depolymerase [Larsenimonas suaedae]MCM2971059.1 polyhydroxyalkanoate depolymerase [Larsenimonas suaedae]MDR5895768.1 polyhydroxyalkanoate depolymerase [Larsenimonas suaedae]
MLYQYYEFQRSFFYPVSVMAKLSAELFTDSRHSLSHLPWANRLAANYELIYRLGKDYEKPEFDIRTIEKGGSIVPIVEEIVEDRPFCRLIRFKRYADNAELAQTFTDEPKVLLCAPLSGHHSTLLRDTVRQFLHDAKVYITDWKDARTVPNDEGPFHLDDYVEYIQSFIRTIGADNLHVISVCQPTVPVLAALSLMAARNEALPNTITMMGGPIDARKSPTEVNSLANNKSLQWFEDNVIHRAPGGYPGAGRKVYPGFLQHAGFVAMNPDLHLKSHWEFYEHLLSGDEEDAESHRRFYDEYNAVLDMPAEYYLDTIRVVFQEYALAKGTWTIRGEPVDPSRIKETALMTVEGERDDISGHGQTASAHDLCTGIDDTRRFHITLEGAGHYGIFSGRRFRTKLYPQLLQFIRDHAS